MKQFTRLSIEDQTDLMLAMRTHRDGITGEWRLSNPSRRIARVLRHHGLDVHVNEQDGTMIFVSGWRPSE